MNRPETQITVSGELILLNKGLYKLFVRSGLPARVGDSGELLLPAVTLAPAPGVAADAIEIMSGPLNSGDWLCAERDVLIVKVTASSTAVLLTSVCAESGRALEIALERINSVGDQPVATAPRELAPSAPPRRKVAPPPEERRSTRLTVMAHIQNRGDIVFEDAFWAGVPGERLAIEAFSISPQEDIAADQLEYRALTAAGAETPWVTGGSLCGERGKASPLVGFAIRLKGGAEQRFDCEYRGAFASGKIVGPLSNGSPCRAAADDPLEAIQFSIRDRTYWEAAAREDGGEARKIGPKFSVFREVG